MDANNYVSPWGTGYRVVVNGAVVSGNNPDGSFSDLGAAQNAFNNAQQGGGSAQPSGGLIAPSQAGYNGLDYGYMYDPVAKTLVPKSATSASQIVGASNYQTKNGLKSLEEMKAELQAAGYNGGWDTQSILNAYAGATGGAVTGDNASSGFDWANYWNAQIQSNQAQFDEAKRQWQEQFNLNKDQWQEQFNLNKDQYRQSLYSNLAQALLNGAVSLSRPKDWIKYAQYTTGGKDIFKRLTGSEAAPAFGVAGYSEPVQLKDIIKDIGL